MTLPPNPLAPSIAKTSNLLASTMTGSSSPLGGTRSMTGFAQYTTVLPDESKLTLELRAVNSRFLDLTIKLPEALRAQETECRTRLTQRIKRGKLELKAHIGAQRQDTAHLSLDPKVLATIASLSSQAKNTIEGFTGPSLSEILALQERFFASVETAGTEPVADTENAAFFAALDHAITQFDASRASEGVRLSQVVLGATESIRVIAESLLSRAPSYIALAQDRLAQRLTAALDPTLLAQESAERIRQEIAALGLRADVAEEINRLLIHCEELKQLVQTAPTQAKEVGKRLDFLCQELNREANTLGSKAVTIELTNASIELKLLIEQIREQAQNFE